MKNAENVNVSKDKKSPRAGSKKEADLLKDQLPGILAYRDLIKDAKGKKQKELRDEFQEEFGVTYNVKLISRLTGEKPAAEEPKAKLEKGVVLEAQSLVEKASADIAIEAAAASSLQGNKDFESKAKIIDGERSDVVKTSIKRAASVAAKKGGKDDIEQMYSDLESLSQPINVDKEPSYDDLALEILSQKDAALNEGKKDAQTEAKAAGVALIIDDKSDDNTNKVGPQDNIEQFYADFDNLATPVSVDSEPGDGNLASEILSQREATIKADKEAEKQEMVAAGLTPAESPVATEIIGDPITNPEVLGIFKSVGLTPEDLKTIPGLDKLNEVSTMLVARSIKMMALEQAETNVNKALAASMSGKRRFGRIVTGIRNTFRQGKLEKRCIAEQANGGLEVHGASLTRMAQWAADFQLQEYMAEGEGGEKKFRIDYLSNELSDHSFDSEDDQALLEGFNDAANHLATLPKYWQTDSAPDKPSRDKAQVEQYKLKKDLYDRYRSALEETLINKYGGGPEAENKVENILNKADARVNMIQFLTANPNLEKEWQSLTKGNSFVAKMFSKENRAFFLGGGVARLALVSAFGYVAAPILGAGFGAWRGRINAEKALRKTDRFIDKKARQGMSSLAVTRKQTLEEIKKLVPAEHLADPKEWLKVATEEEKEKYAVLKLQFNKLEKKATKEDGGNIERKTFNSSDLIKKTDVLLNKIANEDNLEERKLLVAQLIRRINFNYKLADNGLINFGSIEERAVKMAEFYQAMNDEQMLAVVDNVDNQSDATYVISRGMREPVTVSMEKRAEHLINLLEASSGRKLDKKRRWFIAKGMLQGAGIGAGIASAGAVAFGHLDNLTGGWATNYISGTAGVNSAEAISASASEVVSQSQAENATAQVSENIAGETTVESLNSAAPVEQATETTVASTTESTAAEVSATATEATAGSAGTESAAAEVVDNAQAAAEEHLVGSGDDTVWVNKIDHAGDSIWRSVKEIFTDRATELGYKGDLTDTSALSRWAELQTNQTLANSGELTDKVFIGNEVLLERSGDGFVVSVEAAEGAAPSFLAVAEKVVDAASSEVVPVEPELAPDLTNLEAIADAAGSKLGLSAEEVVATTTPNIIRAIIEDTAVFVNTVDNTYFFFNEAWDEVSGFLVDSAGDPVTDLKAFLAERLNADDGGIPGLNGVENALVDQVDLSEEGIRESADKIGLFMLERSASSVETLYNQVLTEVEEATGLESLKEIMSPKEGRIFERIVNQIHEDGYNASSHQKALSKFITRLVTRYGE